MSAVLAWRRVSILFANGRREWWALKIRAQILAIHPLEDDAARARWRKSYRRLARKGRIKR